MAALTTDGSETLAETLPPDADTDVLQGGIERLEGGFELSQGSLLAGEVGDVVLHLLHGQRCDASPRG